MNKSGDTIESLLKQIINGECLRVYVVNPPSLGGPSKLISEFREEKKQSDILYKKALEQHDLLKKSFFWNKILVVVTLVMTLATWTLVVLEWKRTSLKDHGNGIETHKQETMDKQIIPQKE